MQILVVDDKEDSRQTIREMAEMLGHDVIEAENALQGVRLAAANPPNLVLMDLVMPDVDGNQAAAAFRNISSLLSLPIVLVTAFPVKLSPQVRERKWDGLLVKPFSVDDLERVINRFSG